MARWRGRGGTLKPEVIVDIHSRSIAFTNPQWPDKLRYLRSQLPSENNSPSGQFYYTGENWLLYRPIGLVITALRNSTKWHYTSPVYWSAVRRSKERKLLDIGSDGDSNTETRRARKGTIIGYKCGWTSGGLWLTRWFASSTRQKLYRVDAWQCTPSSKVGR
jgi:hypothetical protein